LTVTLHVPPAATLVHVLVWLKLDALVPPRETPVTVSAALPVLVSVSTSAAATVPAGVLKTIVVLLNCSAGVPVPVPASETVWGELAALSVMLSVAL
jgi:hypothetical protein